MSPSVAETHVYLLYGLQICAVPLYFAATAFAEIQPALHTIALLRTRIAAGSLSVLDGAADAVTRVPVELWLRVEAELFSVGRERAVALNDEAIEAALCDKCRQRCGSSGLPYWEDVPTFQPEDRKNEEACQKCVREGRWTVIKLIDEGAVVNALLKRYGLFCTWEVRDLDEREDQAHALETRFIKPLGVKAVTSLIGWAMVETSRETCSPGLHGLPAVLSTIDTPAMRERYRRLLEDWDLVGVEDALKKEMEHLQTKHSGEAWRQIKKRNAPPHWVPAFVLSCEVATDS
ncbi:hypothetical protein JCM10207_004948 [Rhodosporidiobolus poonsookiae]